MKATIFGRIVFPVLLLSAACGDVSSPVPATEETTPGDAAGDVLSIVSGNAQLGEPGAPLAEPVVVRVTRAGLPVAGARVRWSLTGGGRLAGDATTDANGFARAAWTLGDAPESSSLTVSHGEAFSSFFAFPRIGVTRTDIKLVRVAGDAQTGTAGALLGQPLVVKVMSGRTGAMAGVKVRWTVEGGGRIASDSAFSAADGTVKARWTLGTAGGSQSVSASAEGVLPIAFVATAIPTTGEPVTLVRVSGDGQGARVGMQLAAQLVVRATNGGGTPLSGVQVTWSVRTGGGSISPATITTDGTGQAYARWTMGPASGPATAAATVAGAQEVTFNATALPDSRVSALVKVLGDGQAECPGCGLREGIRVMAVDGEGNPVPNAPITWTPSAGTISYSTTVTDATGTAGAGWTLGTTPGVQTLTASSGQVSTAFTATASLGGDGVVASIGFSVGNTGLEPGQSGYARATALDTRGLAVPSAVLTWSTDVPGIIEFTVTPVGSYTGRATFRALKYGEVRLTASAGGQSNTILIRVRPDPNNGGGGGSAVRGATDSDAP
ncbi:Ig-like domain-containing protein [Longimicrobium terrae]|uniref:Big-1 domain-containing protein n=1 Tax=Longimicrobium terrae TaxID=1639882 RepID=A0A841H074_9BACT|nr:Ig-like domain-containing protein [Longimicrobium terrae]MBB4636985.1 hypothetical protein [Longimicrobium terrae]MBB6071407.1 hypothetical protein [Longimicrobium terrae]NNC31378.1 Ig-like domain-containing protein [Longimicrobium terrae]